MIAKFISALIAGVILAGCNTMRGVGQDMERGGEKLQSEAERQKNR